ncbi:MAG TPA: hypothetical protein VFI61_02235 [Patescibacteria group bacterium]|nr:hypothetical protein [Patescibacteria group bacterium]
MPKNSPLFIEIGQGLSVMVGLPTISDWDTLGRPKEAKKGTFGFNSETDSLEFYDGSFWFSAPMTQV